MCRFFPSGGTRKPPVTPSGYSGVERTGGYSCPRSAIEIVGPQGDLHVQCADADERGDPVAVFLRAASLVALGIGVALRLAQDLLDRNESVGVAALAIGSGPQVCAQLRH